MPNDKQIKKIMEKARKAASAGERTPSVKKQDKKLTKDKILEKKDKPIGKDKRKGELQPTKLSTEIQQLVTAVNQQNQRLDKIIGFQEKAIKQVETQMSGQSSQVNPNEVVDQGIDQDNLTDEQRLAQAQAEQDKKGQGVPGQPQMPANVPPALAYLYAFNPTFAQIAATVRTAITKGKTEKEGSGNIYENAGKKIMEAMLTRFMTQQTGGGGNWLEQWKTFLAMQNAVAGGFFNSLKLAGKGQAETIMTNLFRQPQSPEIPPTAFPPSEDHII